MSNGLSTSAGPSTGPSPTPSAPPDIIAPAATAGAADAPAPALPEPSAEELAGIAARFTDAELTRLADGDDCRPETRRLMGRALLDRCEGDAPRLIAAGGGDLAVSVADQLILRSFPGQPVRQRAILAKAAEVRLDLEGENPSAVEKILCERAALCWLDLHIKDLLCLQAEAEGYDRGEMADRLRHRAHARYVGALKALASVRKLGDLTAVQINLGDPPLAGPTLRAVGGN